MRLRELCGEFSCVHFEYPSRFDLGLYGTVSTTYNQRVPLRPIGYRQRLVQADRGWRDRAASLGADKSVDMRSSSFVTCTAMSQC